jgi:hypothetical protein
MFALNAFTEAPSAAGIDAAAGGEIATGTKGVIAES